MPSFIGQETLAPGSVRPAEVSPKQERGSQDAFWDLTNGRGMVRIQRITVTHRYSKPAIGLLRLVDRKEPERSAWWAKLEHMFALPEPASASSCL